MSVLTVLSTMTSDPGLGGGSVVTFAQLSEILMHLEEGRCTEEQLEAMAEAHRGPTPAEWAEMRGEMIEQATDTTPEPTPEAEPAPEPEPEAEATEDPGADENVAPV
jgi:hypothetical protein